MSLLRETIEAVIGLHNEQAAAVQEIRALESSIERAHAEASKLIAAAGRQMGDPDLLHEAIYENHAATVGVDELDPDYPLRPITKPAQKLRAIERYLEKRARE